LTETKEESKTQRIFQTIKETTFLQCEKHLEVKILSACCNFSKTIDGYSIGNNNNICASIIIVCIVKPGPMHLLKVVPGITEALIYVERPERLHCYSSSLSLDYKLAIREDIEVSLIILYEHLLIGLIQL
jgi:hypothetical protein